MAYIHTYVSTYIQAQAYIRIMMNFVNLMVILNSAIYMHKHIRIYIHTYIHTRILVGFAILVVIVGSAVYFVWTIVSDAPGDPLHRKSIICICVYMYVCMYVCKDHCV